MLVKTIKSSLRSSRPEVFLGKCVLKICSKFTGEHPCRSAISIKLLCNFIEITLRYGCSPVNLLHIFTTPFLKSTSGWLFLQLSRKVHMNNRICYFQNIRFLVTELGSKKIIRWNVLSNCNCCTRSNLFVLYSIQFKRSEQMCLTNLTLILCKYDNVMPALQILKKQSRDIRVSGCEIELDSFLSSKQDLLYNNCAIIILYAKIISSCTVPSYFSSSKPYSLWVSMSTAHDVKWYMS